MKLTHRARGRALRAGLAWPLAAVCIGCTDGPVNPTQPSQAPNCPAGQHPYLNSCVDNVVNNPPLPQAVTLALSPRVGADDTPTYCNATVVDEPGTVAAEQRVP